MEEMLDKNIKLIVDKIVGKRCVLYGFGGTGRNLLLSLEDAGIQVDYIVDKNYMEYKEEKGLFDVFNEKYKILDPYDLIYEKQGEVVIVVTAAGDGGAEIDEILGGMGYEKGKEYFCVWDYNIGSCNYIDAILGYSRDYEEDPLFCGFKRYGHADAEYRIVALGGSTTDPTCCCQKSWPEYLYERYKDKDICIYNGGMCGYSSSQEVLKLIRDALLLHPSVIISYSGYNDASGVDVRCFDNNHNCYPYTNPFLQKKIKHINTDLGITFGLENKKKEAEIWTDNERIMNAVCETFNVRFYGILQPCLVEPGEDYIYSDIEKKRLTIENRKYVDIIKNFYRETREMNLFSDWLIDGKSILNGASDLFFDVCHIKEKGNKLIADFIYNILKI